MTEQTEKWIRLRVVSSQGIPRKDKSIYWLRIPQRIADRFVVNGGYDFKDIVEAFRVHLFGYDEPFIEDWGGRIYVGVHLESSVIPEDQLSRADWLYDQSPCYEFSGGSIKAVDPLEF